MKRSAVLLAVLFTSSAAWSQLPVYYGALYGLVADDSTDNCSAMMTLMGIAANAGGGIIQLPLGKFTKLPTCNLQIPNNVIIRGSGNQGWNQGPGVVPSSGLHMTYGGGNFHLECLGTSGMPSKGGLCGLEDLEVLDDATNTPFMLYTCGVPYLRNVMFKGRYSANTPDGGGHLCADHGSICPTNDGIQFGTGGILSSCGTDMVNNDGFNGYGANIIDQVYFQNIRTAVTLLDNANALNFKRLWGDYTDANLTGYFVYINGAVKSAYGNTFEDVDIEQAPNGSMLCNYKGAFGLDNNAQQNQISYLTSDIGSCTNGAYILQLTSHSNDITNLGAYYNGNPAVSDISGSSYLNGIYDMPNETLYRKRYVGGRLVLSFGIDSPTNITGIPNADKFGGIIGFSNTGGMAVTNTGIPLFSDFTVAGTQFTISPAEMWLGQFTLNTSTANGTAPIQMQPNYAVAGAPISQPPVLNLPATQTSGSYLGNGPPLYEPPQNAFMFGSVNALPTGGTAYAIIRGFTASMIGTTQTMLGTYYNHSVPASTTHYTGPSQQTNWTNTNQSLSFVTLPFVWSVQGGLCVYTGSTQPAVDSLVITLQKNTADTTLVVTIPAGGTAGIWCDNDSTHTASGSAGDRINFKIQNKDTGTTSATIQSITLGVTPTSPATGMLIFGLGGRTLMNNNYFAPFGGGNGTTTSVNAQVALPRAVTIKNLHCYLTSCPGASVTFKVYQNTTPGPTVTILSGTCTINTDYTDLVNTLTFAAGDTIELFESQGLGGAGSISSCTVEHD